MIQRPVCYECSIEMRCSKNGRIVKSQAHGDLGYFRGDEYKCPSCAHRVIVGFGQPTSKDVVTPEELESMIVIA